MTSESRPLPEDEPIAGLGEPEQRERDGQPEPAPGTAATNTTDQTVLSTPDEPAGSEFAAREVPGGVEIVHTAAETTEQGQQ